MKNENNFLENATAFAILLIILGASIFGAYFGASHSEYPKPNEPHIITYSGKQTFETETDYSAFKRILGQEDVTIDSITILASEPPIVVQFNATMPSTIDFPYGHVEKRYYVTGERWGMFAIFLISLLAAIASFGTLLESFAKET
jgi:hypothetical protein